MTSWLNLGVCMDQLLWKRAVSLLLEVAFLITSKLLVSRKAHVRILLTFSVITKKLIQGYCFMPAMLHGHQAVLSFSHLTQTLQIFVQHISTSFFVLNCGSKQVCVIIFDSYPYIKSVKNLDKHYPLLYLGSMLLLGATRLVLSVEKVERDLGIQCVKNSASKSIEIAVKRCKDERQDMSKMRKVCLQPLHY